MALVDATDPGHAFAERLGRWLDVNDAMTLYAAHNAAAPAGAGAAAVRPVADPNADPKANPNVAMEFAAEFARVRTRLAQAIATSCTPGGAARIKLPTPAAGAPWEIAASYEPYRRFYLAHQRDMDAHIRPLRARLRERLAQAAPRLGKLAVLDAALDGILGEREGKLLATVPALLEKRFGQLLAAHRQTLAAAQQDDDPALWMQPGGWLAEFCRELQAVLLAELDLRLQPAQGLSEVFGNETNTIDE